MGSLARFLWSAYIIFLVQFFFFLFFFSYYKRKKKKKWRRRRITLNVFLSLFFFLLLSLSVSLFPLFFFLLILFFLCVFLCNHVCRFKIDYINKYTLYPRHRRIRIPQKKQSIPYCTGTVFRSRENATDTHSVDCIHNVVRI